MVVPGEDQADVAVAQRLGESGGVLQGEGVQQRGRPGQRRMVQDEDGALPLPRRAARGGLGERLPQPGELAVLQAAVPCPGHARVQHDHAAAAGQGEHPVLDGVAAVARAAQRGVGAGVVVVAHRDHEHRPGPLGEGVEDAVQQAVAVLAAVLGGVPGVDDHVEPGRIEPVEQAAQSGLGVDPPVVPGLRVAEQVRVAHMQDPHGGSVRGGQGRAGAGSGGVRLGRQALRPSTACGPTMPSTAKTAPASSRATASTGRRSRRESRSVRAVSRWARPGKRDQRTASSR